MVQPTQPKGIKPKSEARSMPEVPKAANAGSGNLNPIVVNGITTLLICIVFVGSNYFIVKSSLNDAISKINVNSEVVDDEENGEVSEAPGLILDLGEFILNLSDIRSKRYLKINVAIELTRLETDPGFSPAGEKKAGGHGGGHGGGGGGDATQQIEAEMSQYKPAIRDSVISILSSKTAEELSSIAGKELAKEQIKEAVNAIFGGVREVKRISFGNFIIQ